MADEERHTLALIAGHLIKAAEPLIEAGSSLGAFMRLMARIGFFVSDAPPPYQALATSVGDGLTAIENLPASPSLQDLLALLDKAKAIYDAVQQLASGPVPSGADASAYAAEIGERLFELLLTDYLAAEQPDAYNILAMLNVIEAESIAATPTRPAYVRTHFRWEELPKVVSDPSGLPARVYHWGEADFRDNLVLEHLGALGLALGLPIAFRPSDSELLAGYVGTPNMFPPPSGRSLILPFFYANVGRQTIEGALALHRLPGTGGAPPGLILEPRLPSEMPLEFDLAPSARLKVRAGTNLGELFGVTLSPPDVVSLRFPLAPGTPPPAAGVGVSFTYTPDAAVVLLGDPKATRIELRSASAEFGVEVSTSDIDFHLGAELDGLKVVIAAGDGDSFLRTIVGDTPAAIDVPLGVEWSRAGGIRFKGSAALEVTLHPHLHLGPLSINDATVKVSAPSGGPPAVKLEVSVGIAGALGPLKFLVQGIGIAANVTFQHGNAGPFDISLGFKPPDGIGLEIDAGGFTGGGFLILEPDKGQYSGGLDLMFQGTISVRALAILDTKTPDGGEGFSLLILITSEFPPIQLPFGFTLLGVGGLLGLNRTALLESLEAGLHDGTLNSILFPTDIVVNAARIIGDLRRVFPPQHGHFLIGPMAKLGWGTPTLINLEVGVILDLPRPIISFIGIVHAALPADDIPILSLQVNFVGSIDFAAGQLRFDATLYDSRVLNYTLTGDMAVRFYWKDHPNLLLTVGGFNPAYTPPPMNLGKLSRVSIVLFEGNPDVRAEGYFAVTSNTIQFGARVQLTYEVHGFGVEGFLGVDAVIHPLPFHFTADTTAMLAVRAGGSVLFSIQLELVLEGPVPWHAHGTASFEIGFIFTITIHVSFDITIGLPLDQMLAPIDVLAELADALANPGNWRPRLPPSSHQSVTLRVLPDPRNMLIVHPFGLLEVSQKVVPLNVAIQRFGSTTPDNGRVFRIVDAQLGGNAIDVAPTQEEFAPAQFFEMSDAEKLSRPSFDRYDSGIAIGGESGRQTDFMRARAVTYEVIYLPEHQPTPVRYPMPLGLSHFALAGAAVAQSPLSQAATSPSALADRVILTQDRFILVSTDDLAPHAPGVSFDGALAADQALRALLRERPELTGAVQVMPAAMGAA
jgi:Family of unknown function (DUF6603)